MKTKNKLRYLAILVTSFALSLLSAQFSFAESNGLAFTPLGGTVVDGFINDTNTSFSIGFDISDLEPEQTAYLMIGDTTLQSYTKPAIELYTMPSSVNIKDFFVTGPNIIHIDVLNESGDILKNYPLANVFADFIAPDGTISFSTETGSLKLGIGSQINLNFQPDVATDDIGSVTFNFANREIVGVLQVDGSYSAQYAILASDGSSDNVIVLSSILDTAGNITEKVADTEGLTIDTLPPVATIQNPENGKTYNTSDIRLNYSIDSNNYTVVLLLNGKEIFVENGQNIVGLKDGSYELELMATDEAGNITKAMTKFDVDTTPPVVETTNDPSGSKILQGSTVIFAGTSEPGATILLEIFSDDPQTAKTIVGDDGKWSIEFATGNLGVGIHDAYITVSDSVGNSYKTKISSFEIYVPKKIAYLKASSSVGDVTPEVVNLPKKVISQMPKQPQEREEVAKQGTISATENARTTGINWSAWIVLLGIVVLASALATAGYYGYAWAIAYEQDQKKSEPTQISKLDSTIQSEIEEEDQSEPPRNNTPRTRW